MSDISLCMRPGAAPLGWGEFCATHDPYAIALDGYVAASSRFDPSGPRLNLDHHAGVDRLATRATCAQVGGSPRAWGSRLPPGEVERVVNGLTGPARAPLRGRGHGGKQVLATVARG